MPARTQPRPTSRRCSNACGFVLIMPMPIQMSTMPPEMPIITLAQVAARTVANPSQTRRIIGSSTMPWPSAMSRPASLRCRPFVTVTAVTGPGAITPVREMVVTVASKAMREPDSCIVRLNRSSTASPASIAANDRQVRRR